MTDLNPQLHNYSQIPDQEFASHLRCISVVFGSGLNVAQKQF